MTSYTLVQRAHIYHEAFPDFPPLRADSRWIDGVWVMGNNYKGSGYYGAYPPAYLKRMSALFPDAEKILHLFSGSLPKGNYTRFDCNKDLKPEVVGDSKELTKRFRKRSFDLIYADPPYSAEDAKRYGTVMINRQETLRQCSKLLQHGGYLVWLDTTLPIFSKKLLHWCGAICVVRSTNHRVRLASIFKKT